MNSDNQVDSVPVQQVSFSNDHSFQTMIPTKNMPSPISYYCGVFGLLPIVGLGFSVAGIVLGLVGLSKFRINPTPGARGHAIAGLVLGITELVIFMIFVVIIVFNIAR